MVIQADSHESGLFLQFSKFFGEGLMQGFFWRVWKGERILLVFAILVFSFQGLAQPAGYYDEIKKGRITSYNVCYTKLLRKIWLGIKWLSTYISIRPNELRNLKEGHIDLKQGFLFV